MPILLLSITPNILPIHLRKLSTYELNLVSAFSFTYFIHTFCPIQHKGIAIQTQSFWDTQSGMSYDSFKYYLSKNNLLVVLKGLENKNTAQRVITKSEMI
jgi:hypothetical protein